VSPAEEAALPLQALPTLSQVNNGVEDVVKITMYNQSLSTMELKDDSL
jgi:hypothetical protein